MSETVPRCGMPVFPGLTQLDLTGPYEVLVRLPARAAATLQRR